MAFRTTRGRPKSARPHGPDLGTPELIFKRAHDITAESIDLCHQRGIISDDMHWCGLHLRWLYTIRYGAPSVSALDLSRIDGLEHAVDDPLWRSSREQEWAEAAALLKSKQLYLPVASVCIFNLTPRFLNKSVYTRAFKNPKLMRGLEDDIMQLREGLDMLAAHWGRVGQKPIV